MVPEDKLQRKIFGEGRSFFRIPKSVGLNRNGHAARFQQRLDLCLRQDSGVFRQGSENSVIEYEKSGPLQLSPFFVFVLFLRKEDSNYRRVVIIVN